jgi:hypothetical protein
MAIAIGKAKEGAAAPAAPEAAVAKPEAAPASAPRPQVVSAPASRGSTMLGVCLLLATVVLLLALVCGFGAMKLLFVKPF